MEVIEYFCDNIKYMMVVQEDYVLIGFNLQHDKPSLLERNLEENNIVFFEHDASFIPQEVIDYFQKYVRMMVFK